MSSTSVKLETSVFLKAMLKQMLFQGKIRTSEALSHFSREITAPSCRKPHTVFIKADGVKIDSSAEKQPITLIRESKPAANTNIHQTLSRILPCFNLFLCLLQTAHPQWRLRMITQYFSTGSLHCIWKYFASEQGAFISIGQQKCIKTTPSMTF